MDTIVDDLACSANLKRQDFHVRAAPKGLIASNALEMTLTSGDLTLSPTMASPLYPKFPLLTPRQF